MLLGGVLTWMVKQYLPGTIADNLAIVWAYIQDWCKDTSGLGKDSIPETLRYFQIAEATFKACSWCVGVCS